jgi:parvulin-like peptidyl-prolyl isomerase
MKSFFIIVSLSLILMFPAIFTSNCIAEELSYDSIKIFVNDAVITKNEIEIRLFEELNRQKIPISNQEVVGKTRVEIEDRLIEEALLNARADEMMIYISDDVLENQLDKFRSDRKLSKSGFEDLLEHQQMSLIAFKKNYANQMRRSQVVAREIRSRIQISDEKLLEIYDQKEREYIEVRAKHIFKKVSADSTEDQKEKARQQIIWITDQIKNGETFKAMALKYSDDPSVKSNKGDLGYFKKDEILKAVSDVAFILPVDILSEPVLSELGFHLLMVTDKKKAEKKPFNEIKDQLYQEEHQKIFPEQFKKYIDNLKSQAIIKYN